MSISSVNWVRKECLAPGFTFSISYNRRKVILLAISSGQLKITQKNKVLSLLGKSSAFFDLSKGAIRIHNIHSHFQILYTVEYSFKQNINFKMNGDCFGILCDNHTLIEDHISPILEGKLSNAYFDTLNRFVNSTITETSNLVEGKNNRIFDSRLIKVHRYIRSNYQQQVTLYDLSKLIQCNPTYLCNTYSKVFGISPIYHLNKLRMEHAINLLHNKDIQIREIAMKSGYLSSSHFCVMFKKYYNITPRQYREGVRASK